MNQQHENQQHENQRSQRQQSGPESPESTQTLYVSWGGTGRSASLRAAFVHAAEVGGPLVYLAVLDDSTFSDVDQDLAVVVADELEWLLDAQINLTRSQLGLDDLPVRVAVRQGDVVEEIAGVIETLGSATILVGAPVPIEGHDSIESFLASIEQRTGQPTKLATR